MAKPLAVITASDLQMAADAHVARQSAAAAVRYVRPVLKWAAQRGYASGALAVLHAPATVQRRDRVLTRDELRAVLTSLSTSSRTYAAAMRFMLLTLARREEVAGALWRDIDLEAAIWILPNTKNGRPHKLPLSHQAIALLRQHGPGEAGDLVFTTAAGGRLSNWDRETKVIQADSGTTGWTRHDLRRTGATMLGEMGIEPHIIEAALNHTEVHSRLASTYNRARYLPAVATALQQLADALDNLVADTTNMLSFQHLGHSSNLFGAIARRPT